MKDYYLNSVQDIEDLYKRLMNYVQFNKESGKSFERMLVTIKKATTKNRTPPQLRLYWVVVGQAKKAFSEVGYEYTKDQIHEFFKGQNDLFEEEHLDNGTLIRMPKSLSSKGSVDTKELTAHIEYIKNWVARELGYFIQD